MCMHLKIKYHHNGLVCSSALHYFSTDKYENHEVKIKVTHQELHMLMWHMPLRRKIQLSERICS